MPLQQMKQTFQDLFNESPTASFFAPGRINLIGEHIDYNGGLVFPCPITLGTYAVVSQRNDNKVSLYSMNFEDMGVITFDLDNLAFNKSHNWTNYIKGVLTYLKETSDTITTGFNAVIFGNIPNGSGLSSSASLELLGITLCKALYNLTISPVDAALLGKKVENNYIGVNSGIMDQFAISLGKKDQAILLNCDTLDFSYAPFVLENHAIVIMNTNKRRELADSKYNERRAECDSALAKLQTRFDIANLCALSLADFEKVCDELLTPIEIKRVRHAITENKRVKDAFNALQSGDLVAFGKYLNGSHHSLETDYEVTGKELDTLVHAAWEVEGVLGARMTGAGFGGCALALVENDKVDTFIQTVGNVYEKTIGYPASFYIAHIGDGPSAGNWHTNHPNGYGA